MAVGAYKMYPLPRVWQPASVAEAWELRCRLGVDSCYVSGGTLLRTQWESGTNRMPSHLISLEGIQEMKGIRSVTEKGDGKGSVLHIGALTPLEECRRHSDNELLREACRVIAAPSIRNIGTIGGNVASRIGDAIPALLVQNAEMVWFHGKGWTVERLDDWLSLASGSSSASAQSILTGIRVGLSDAEVSKRCSDNRVVFYHKIGRREAFVPSLITVAGSMRVDSEKILRGVRLAVGGGSSVARRLVETEILLEGAQISPALLRKVVASVSLEWSAFKDAFATAEYRQTTASNLIVSELWKELRRQSNKSCS